MDTRSGGEREKRRKDVLVTKFVVLSQDFLVGVQEDHKHRHLQ